MYQHAKNQFIPSVHSSDTVNFRVLPPKGPHQFLMLTPKIFNHLLICVNLYQHAKNQLIPTVHSSDTVNFRVQNSDWLHPFLTMSNQKISTQSQCCLTFSWIQLQMLLRCCLFYRTIIVQILYLVHFCPCLDLVLFMLYLFFIVSLIFICLIFS